MKFNKKVLIIFGFGFLIVIAMGFFVLKNKDNSSVTMLSSSPSPNYYPTTSKVQIDNQVTNNFYKSASFNYPNGNSVIEENQNYQIAYTASDKQFLITLFDQGQTNLGVMAENAFLTDLKITKNQACNLSVSIRTYTNGNLNIPPLVSRLSFCK